MSANVIPLYPQPGSARPVRELYLEERLHELGNPAAPLVYASFVSSLDGRIALAEPGDGNALEGLTSANDFRLFQELQAQADCMITHGGYLRALNQGHLGNVLQINADDLLAWRRQNGLQPQPAIVVASGTLDFPLHASIAQHRQSVYIATGRGADPLRVEALREQGYEVIVAGEGVLVEGAPLAHALGERGYQSLYLLAGPKMLETMLRDRQLARLFLTLKHRFLGGTPFHSLIEGPQLGESGRLALRSLYYDPGEPTDSGQWFSQFDCPR